MELSPGRIESNGSRSASVGMVAWMNFEGKKENYSILPRRKPHIGSDGLKQVNDINVGTGNLLITCDMGRLISPPSSRRNRYLDSMSLWDFFSMGELLAPGTCGLRHAEHSCESTGRALTR